MNKRLLVTTVAIMMALGLVACASSNSDSDTEVNETVKGVAEVIEAVIPDSGVEDITEEELTLTEEQEKMIGPMSAILLRMYSDDSYNDPYRYAWDDPVSVERTLYTFISNWRPNIDDGTGRMTKYDNHNYIFVTEDLLKEYTSALFADYNGSLPELNDIYETDGGFALLSTGGGAYLNAHVVAWNENPDGSYSVRCEFWDPYDTPYFGAEFTLIDNPNATSFPDLEYVYSVASVENSNIDRINNYGYILPALYMHEYTEEELSGFTKEELELAQYEIYARNGLIFDDPELDSYFRNKDWYNPYITADNFKPNLSGSESSNMYLIQKMLDDMAYAEDYEDNLISIHTNDAETELKVKYSTFRDKFDNYFNNTEWNHEREENVDITDFTGTSSRFVNSDYLRDGEYDVITFSGTGWSHYLDKDVDVEFTFAASENNGILSLYLLSAKYDGRRYIDEYFRDFINSIYE